MVHRLIEHETLFVETTAPRPPRHLNILIGSQKSFPRRTIRPLLQREKHHRLGRHVEPHRERLRRKQNLHESACKEDFHNLLEQWL